ncbi:tripartite tricarboxylate transporter TctB family protein [Pacificibacter sp.]|uniref:tripartite tricarboxylate transporter TctB family protein n=1 Tax=Pacificibacter sp. TaxID=1917866 RepID=UPI00321B43FF
MPNRLFGVTIAALSILFLMYAVPTIDSDQGFFSVGPKLFPNIGGSLTLIFGLLIALQKNGETETAALQTKDARVSLGLVLGITLGFILLLSQLGFLISVFLTLAAFLVVFGERRVRVILPVALGVPVVVHLIFLNLFALELPTGPLDFLLGGL